MNIKNVIIDITGVLYESGLNKPIAGSVEAVHQLSQSCINYVFLTNETERTRSLLVEKLRTIGFDLNEGQIISPGIVCRNYLQQHQLRPHLLISPHLKDEFKGISVQNPNCVVLGDAMDEFSYEKLNKAFQVLMQMEDKKLITMGKGKFYQNYGELWLDVGAYAEALHYASGTNPIVIGKPCADYFKAALDHMKANANETLMIGDDIESDVAAAQALGIKGCLVRSGKYRAQRDEPHATVRPYRIVDNLKQLVDQLLSQ